jgi:hypothetical protein
MRARMKESLNYFWRDQRILEASSCKYLGIINAVIYKLCHLSKETYPKGTCREPAEKTLMKF